MEKTTCRDLVNGLIEQMDIAYMCAEKEMNPGSDEAIDAGCRCPCLDNGHGRGYLGGVKGDDGNTVFIVSSECPLHGAQARRIMEEMNEDR